MATNLRVDAYFEAIDGLPIWAITEARSRVLRGSVPDIDKRFAPTPPQFAEIVRHIVNPPNPFVMPGGASSMRLPDAPPMSEDVVKGFEELKSEIRAAIKPFQNKAERAA